MNTATWILLTSMLTVRAVAADTSLVVLGTDLPYQSYAEVFAAVEVKLHSSGRAVQNYHASVDGCDPDACGVLVFSRDVVADPRVNGIYKGCPGEFCASMTFSRESRSITRVVRWK